MQASGGLGIKGVRQIAIKALKKIEKKLQPSELVEALEEGADLCGIAEEDDSAD